MKNSLRFLALLLLPSSVLAWDCDDEASLDRYSCEDFTAYANYSAQLWLQLNILTPLHQASGGWDGGSYLRMRLNDYGGESGAGYYPPVPAGNSHNTPQLNVGFFIRFGSDFSPKVDVEEYKATMVLNHYFATQGSGDLAERPIIMDKMYRNPSDPTGPPIYRTFTACSEAGGGCLFPPPNPPPFEWRDSSPQGNSPYQHEDYLGEWVYVEYELIAGGNVSLYIMPADNPFDFPYVAVPATADMGNLGRVHVIMGYWEGAGVENGSTTVNTYYDIDFVRTDNQYMGPPPGWLGSDPPDPPQLGRVRTLRYSPTQLRIP